MTCNLHSQALQLFTVQTAMLPEYQIAGQTISHWCTLRKSSGVSDCAWIEKKRKETAYSVHIWKLYSISKAVVSRAGVMGNKPQPATHHWPSWLGNLLPSSHFYGQIAITSVTQQ